MNPKQKYKNRRFCSDHIKTMFKNVLKISMGNSESREHKDMKYMIIRYLSMHSLNYGTEVTFNNGSRADIVVLDWGLAIEVLRSEKPKSFFKKNYPLPTIPVNSNKLHFELIKMLEELRNTNGKAWEYYVQRFRKHGL